MATDLADAVEALDIKDSASAPKPKVPNFPIPRELRDKIYAHLLDGREVQYTPQPPSTPNQLPPLYLGNGRCIDKYRFHTNILAVNKAIHSEALDFFNSTNSFVLVSCNSRTMPVMLYSCNVPFIIGRGLQDIQGHAFALDIRRKHKIPSFGPNDLNSVEYLVVLRKDLPSLFTALRFMSYRTYLPVVFVNSGEGQKLVLKTKEVKKDTDPQLVRVDIKCVGDTVAVAHQSKFLVSLELAIGCGFTMSIEGFSDEQAAKGTLAKISPSPVWPLAVAWDRFDMLLTMKEGADNLALSEPMQATAQEMAARYKHILQVAEQPYLKEYLQAEDDRPSDRDIDIDVRCSRLIIDLVLSAVWFELRCGSLEAAHETLALADVHNQIPYIWDATHDSSLKVAHASLVLQVLEMDGKPKPPSSHTLSLMSRAEAFIEHTQDPYTVLDAGEICSATMRGGDTFKLNLDQLSMNSMPMRSFNSAVQDGGIGIDRPKGLKGYQDVEHLAKFTDADKKKVNELEKKVGLPVTRFT